MSLRFDYSGKTVLVTGASQGIGAAIALAFHDAGARVHVTGTRDTPESYELDLASFTYHRCRMESDADRAALAEAIPALDILINNAGMTRADEYETDGFAHVVQVNLVAVADLCYRFRARLAAAKGAIVNLGSVSARIGLRDHPAYTASKHGISGLTKSLADKWARDIRVNSVDPGFVETRMTDWARAKPEDHARFLKQVPANRFGAPEDVAQTVLFLASPEASYVRGESIAVDGGYLLR